jgi:DNA topoisomerase-2
MPIWSLTKERVDRLLQQMGDKEAQIDALIKLSKEDIWKKELKEFIDTWRFQLEEEKALQKKVANLGRRASAKLKTAKSTASRKRKGDESDFDSDFNGGKPAKKAAIAKKDKPVSKPKQTLLSDFAPSIRPPAPPPSKPAEPQHKDVWMEGLDDSDAPVAPKPKAVAKPIAPVKKGPAAKPPKPVKIDSDFDDDDEPVVPKGKAPAANGRAPRAAARKPAIYTLNSDSESDNGDDMLFDVGNMVKGLNPPPSSETAPARPLFSDKASASRPGSSAGLGLGRKSVSRGFESDSNDETDYKGLASGGGNFRAPVKRAGLFSDDENDEPVVVKKPLEKKKPVVKEKEKVKAVPAAQKEPVQEKRLVLSPAAKAYAAKQTKANGAGASKPAVKAKAKTDFSDDDDDDDDLMEIDSRPVAKVREASVVSDIGGRPSRRAAAAKPKAWIVEDDEDEESESAVESGSEDFDDSD